MVTRVAKSKKSSRPPSAVRVLRQFRIVFNAVRTHFQQVEKHAGVGGAHVWALSAVRDQPGLGVGALAAAMDIHQSTASNLVRSLVEKGLLVTERDEVDRRATRLWLSAEGGRVLRRAPAPFAGVLPEALGALEDATLKRLETDLDAVIRRLDAVNRRDGRKPLADI